MRRTRFSEEQIARALRLAHEGKTAAEIDAEIGKDAAPVDLTPIEDVSAPAIAEIARDVFGSDVTIVSLEPIVPIEQHGIPRRSGFTGNLLYRVQLQGMPKEYVFRFNRGLREDVFEEEAENYRLVAEATGVRTPEIVRVDRSQRLLPTAFMVLEFLHGDHWCYLAHPGNPETDASEKQAIRRKSGEFLAALHGVTRPARDALEETHHILWGLYRLRDAVAAGALDIEARRIQRCLDAVEREPVLRIESTSLCLVDGEICFARGPGGFELAFVCDLEWVGHRDPYSDLVTFMNASGPLWEFDVPLIDCDPRQLEQEAFFAGYAARREVDFERLAQLPPFHQLRTWGHAIADSPPPVQAWLRKRKGPLIGRLVDWVAARPDGPRAS